MLAGQAITNVVSDLALMNGKGTKGSSDVNGLKEKNTSSFEHMLKSSFRKKQPSNLNTVAIANHGQKVNDQTLKTMDSSLNKVTGKNSSMNAVQQPATKEMNASSASQTKDKVVNAAKNMKDIVKDELDLNDDQLQVLMQILGITALDLFNMDTLKQLVLTNAQTDDATTLLTDESLSNQYGNLIDELQQQMEINQITTSDVEQIKTTTDEFAAFLSEKVPPEKAPERNVNVEDLAVGVQKDIQQDKEPEESKVEFTVIREGTQEKTDSVMASQHSNKGQTNSHSEAKSESQLVTQFMDQIADHSIIGGQEANFGERLSEIHQTREIANQIIDAIKIIIKPSQTSMELTLNPEHLGKVALNISSKAGVITASFTTDNQIAKEAIESQMQVLKDNLNQQGVKVEAIEVTVSEFGFQQDAQMSQDSNSEQHAANHSKRSFRVDAGDFTLDDQTEPEDEKLTMDAGTQFDYSA